MRIVLILFAISIFFTLVKTDTSSNTIDTSALHWENAHPGGAPPPPRFYPAHASYDHRWTITGGEKHSHGDQSSSVYTDMWDYDFAENKWINRTVEMADEGWYISKSWRSAVYRRSENQFLLWGGRRSETDVVHILQPVEDPQTSPLPTEWIEQLAPFPSLHVAGYAWFLYGTYPQYLYVFGGIDYFSSGTAYGRAKIFKYELDSELPWKELTNTDIEGQYPIARYMHAGAYRSQDNSWYMFGGTTDLYEGQHLNDLWRFSVVEENWEQIIHAGDCIPQPRAAHSVVITPDGMGLFVFGGVQYSLGSLNDLWMFHFSSKQWLKYNTGGWDNNYRDGHAATVWVDPVTSIPWMYVFGGDNTEDKEEVEQSDQLFRISLGDTGCTYHSYEDCKYVDLDCGVSAGFFKKNMAAMVVLVVVLSFCVTGLLIVGIRVLQKPQLE
eukprot:TRINITY_DN3465_c0_g5_i1.p1 TRINITY_DN3465_c0_g5~~TRINITY_DN3465_c0_g5_i1.p1  ORF type:complete len:439 (-),score=89.57 TRINITY_DN3465_c0_g5_i1:10-1326(-)